MYSCTDGASRRIPTLVQCCQRVAAIHVNSISGFGEELRYDLIKPILERSSVETLIRLEESSPHLQAYTPGLWKDFCFRLYPLYANRCCLKENESWKNQFFSLRELEAQKLEELGRRLRNKRLKADGEKKEREVKISDGFVLNKYQRNKKWSTIPQPKTLFQKTRSEASRIQKNMFSPQMIPRMPNGQTYRVLHNTLSAKLPPAPPSATPSRITINRIQYLQPTPSKSTSSLTTSSSSPEPKDAPPYKIAGNLPLKKYTDPPPPKSPQKAGKKDPMATLFVPKHRAHSQLPIPPPQRTIPPVSARNRAISLRF